jgi:hypothetical protein
MSTITGTFDYDFTDSNGSVFDLTITATNSETSPTVFTISSITGTVTPSGSLTSYAVTGVSVDFNGPDNTLSNTTGGYSTSTYWNNNGVSFNTADGLSYNLYSTGINRNVNYAFNSDGISSDVNTGSNWTVTVSCFMPGTYILTTKGEVLVENLKTGDVLPTLSGKNIPIQWIGKQKLQGAFLSKDKSPVCISAGSLGEGLPKRDLYVSAGHSMKIADHLVDARLLVNGVTITQHQRFEPLEYYHIDLGEHHCILAEGAWSESYLECNDNRKSFANADEFYDTYPNHVAQVLPEKCLPHVADYQDPRHPALFKTLLAHIPADRVTTDPDLHLLADGKRLDSYEFVPQAFVFRVPAATQVLRLKSRTSRPCELGLPADDRQLGFCLQSLSAQSEDGTVKITLEPHHTKLLKGFHRAEGTQHRWTQGDALLPSMLLDDGTEEMTITIKGRALPRYHLNYENETVSQHKAVPNLE